MTFGARIHGEQRNLDSGGIRWPAYPELVSEDLAGLLAWLDRHPGPLALTVGTGEDALTVQVPQAVGRGLRDVVRVVAASAPVIVLPAGRDVTTTQAAALLGISRTALMERIHDGTIPARKVGTHWRMRLSDILDARERLDAVAREEAALARIALARALNRPSP